MARHRWTPFLHWPRPTAALLRGEVIAGLSVALLMVPQSVAYAQLAGMPLVTGLYAALLPAVVAALLGNSTRISVGATALTGLLVFASLDGLAAPGSADWVNLAVWLALMSGAVQLAMGAGGLGWMLNLISVPVLTGFTQAAALLIMASQLPALLGLGGPQATSLAGLWQGAAVDARALAFGLAALALALVGPRWRPRWPWVLVVMVAGGAASAAQGFAAGGGAVVGALPAGLPAPFWPQWPGLAVLGALLVPALVIALVSFLETSASARIEAARDGRRWDDNQDLLAQGAAKLASAFSGSFATSASFSRSAIALHAGARTGWSTLAMAAFVALALLVAMPLLAPVPRAVLAAVVVAAVAGLLRPAELPRLWRIDRIEAATALVTFGVTLASAPRIYWGVGAGVVMGLAHFLYLHLHPRIIEVGEHADGSLRDRHLWHLPPIAPGLLALRMDAELDFASASALERRIVEELAMRSGLRDVALFMLPVNRIDATGVETFARLRVRLAAAGITLHLAGTKLPVQQAMERAGVLRPDTHLRLYRTDAEALAALRAAADPSTASQTVTIQPSSGSNDAGRP